MKLLDTMPEEVKKLLQTEHQKALRKLLHNREFSNVLPMHTARMMVNNQLKKVILPPLEIFVDPDIPIKNNKISRGAIGYRITYNQVAFPLGHVYGSSGYLCLGNIFVPSMIPINSPQQPLETLLLHNDRNVNHGNPKIPITNKQREDIRSYLEMQHLPTSRTHINQIYKYIESTNWVKTDTLWEISAFVLDAVGNENLKLAFYIMDDIFKCVFPKSFE